MQAILLKIQWQQSVEFIPLDLSDVPSSGTIETFEQWSDGADRVVYRARCEIERSGRGYSVRLAYAYEDNQALADVHGVDLGTSEIKISPNLRKATVNWSSDTDPASFSGQAENCWVIDAGTDDNATTRERYMAEVIARPGQALLRRGLLMVDCCCALSGERLPVVLDAAHIDRVADNGGDGFSNGILLRTDLHRLYDAGAFALEDDGTVRITPDLSPDYIKLLQNAALPREVHVRVAGSLRKRNARDAERAKEASRSV